MSLTPLTNLIHMVHQIIIDYIWVIAPTTFVIAASLVNYILGAFHNRIHPRLESTQHTWDDTIFEALHKPLKAYVWIITAYLSLKIIDPHIPAIPILNNIVEIKDLGVEIVVFWFLMRCVRNIEARLIENFHKTNSGRDQTTVHAIGLLMRILIFIAALLVTLQVLGIPISGLLAFGGIGGIGVALAAKDSLANFFGGMMIFIDRPFQVGDWIRSPDKDIEGTVEHIGWRLTRIRTFDKRPRYIPNGVFSGIIIDNPSRMLNRRIKTTIGLRYDDASKLQPIIDTITEMLENHPDIDTRQILMVNFIQFSASSLDLQIYTFTKTVNWKRYMNVRQDVFLKTIEIIEQHQAECAFPTQTLHVPDGIEFQQAGK